MNRTKIKLTSIMIITTVILFIITFLSVYLYQKNYIFDKAIYSIENELTYFNNYDKSPEEDLLNRDRVFNVEVIFPDDKEVYLQAKERKLLENYHNNKYNLGEIITVKNNFGEFYCLIEEVSDDLFIDYKEESSTDNKVPILLYIDVTSSSNVIKKINYIFFIMLVLSIIVEGLVGVYLGSSFEKSQKKLKHFFENASHELKTPLMSIMGYAEGIKTGVIEDKDMASDVIIKKSKILLIYLI